MAHSKKRSRGSREEKDGEGSDDQSKRRRDMRVDVEEAELLKHLKKLKMKAFVRRAVMKELARLIDNSGLLNLVQEQVEKGVQEKLRKELTRLIDNSELSNLVQEQVEGCVQEKLRKELTRLVDNSGLSNLVQEQVERSVEEKMRKELTRLLDNSELSNLVQEQVERGVQEKFTDQLRKELTRLVNNSGLSNLVQEQEEKALHEEVKRFSQISTIKSCVEVAGHVSNSPRLPAIPAKCRYRLQFQNGIPEVLYTCTKLKSKGNKDVEIALIDTVVGSTAASCPWSSAKVEVVVLDGDFCTDGQERRDNETFREHAVKPRKGKGPLLLGEVVIKLEKGFGRLTDITFTDNSGSSRSGRFRLGLILHQNEDADVGEGMSDPFKVKHYRVKGNEKHHPPELTDAVHHLVKIRKDGPIHKRLNDGGISTVKQLLRFYNTDPENLRRLIGCKRGVAQGTLEAIIKHASECNPGTELYSYDITEQGVKLIFNSIFELHAVYCGDSHYEARALTAEQQGYVQNLKKEAFKNLTSIQSFNPPVVGCIPNTLQQIFPSSADQELAPLIGQHHSVLWSGGWSEIMSTDAQFLPELPYDLYADLSHIELPPDSTPYHEANSYSCPAIGLMNHPSYQEEDINIMFVGYRHQWVKVIARLKSVIFIAKYLALKRCGK